MHRSAHPPSSDAVVPRSKEPSPGAPTPRPAGGFTELDGRPMYCIAEYDRMPPFLLSLVSPSNHWLYVSSRGGLTAGRVHEDLSLFPYETVDRLHHAHHDTGPVTRVRVGAPDTGALWVPFAEDGRLHFDLERRLYKSPEGHELVFEELNRDLGLGFRYRWATSESLGFVRTARLHNLNPQPVRIELLDGLRHVQPPGIPLGLQRNASCLADAYKQAELNPDSGLAIYSLTARISDMPHPAEALRASVAWCRGLEPAAILLSEEDSLGACLNGEAPRGRPLVRGCRGAYLVHTSFVLEAGGERRWDVVADIGLDAPSVVEREAWLRRAANPAAEIEADVSNAGEALRRLVAAADGVQRTSNAVGDAHHFANTLFNCMRGGVFETGHRIPAADFRAFVADRQRAVAGHHREFLAALPDSVELSELLRRAAATGDADLRRICHEYLPLSFSRRHGDPSRPWNRFAIHVRNPDGSRRYYYQGNWRDIFQNWEALAVSFPAYLESMIAKFVNASTVDGFNPYRITRDGIDWEVPEHGNPWSNIGYWGDHQIVYLLKLLEAAWARDADSLRDLLGQSLFAYADVPYRLRPYADILRNCRSTIRYDAELAARLQRRKAEMGADGLLASTAGGSVRHVTLAEKLLVPALSKICNLVLDGGIWLNTQRPEWNDANNALAGPGLSVVTVGHLRRYLVFLQELFDGSKGASIAVSAPVVDWLREVLGILTAHGRLLTKPQVTDADRRRVLDELGEAFSRYRGLVYEKGLGATASLSSDDVAAFLGASRSFAEHTLQANRRPDGLYHSYNLLHLGDGRASVQRLDIMLEGQVSALNSGLISPEETVALVDAMYASALYRPDQNSFLLYPNRELPRFLDKNRAPAAAVEAIGLLRDLQEASDTTLLVRDARGDGRFHPDLANAADVERALDALAADPARREAVERDRRAVLDLYEQVFHHRTFTGRSGTMVAYEGLGSIYWHMVAKLLLAVQEVHQTAVRQGAPDAVCAALAQRYYRIRAGLSAAKTPAEYGAFPFDPHSHTPAERGAQQPGMTGQVKEEILTRFGELGVGVSDGCLLLRPTLLRVEEFLTQPGSLEGWGLDGATLEVPLACGEIAFTLCQVPVVYRKGRAPRLTLTLADGSNREIAGDRLDRETSADVLRRTGRVVRIDVTVPESSLLGPPGP